MNTGKTEAIRCNFLLNIIDLLVLASFAFAQPLFDVLSRSEEMLVVHGSKPVDVVLLAAAASLGPAVLLILTELIARWFLPRSLAVIHGAFVSLLLAFILLPLVKRPAALPAAAAVALAAAAGVFFAVQYLRIRTWRWSVVYLSPLVLIFPALFLLHSPVAAIVLPSRAPQISQTRIGNPVPVVLIVFDEFPLASLLDEKGEIDAKQFPNFAELARTGTWYRNATTVAEGTLISVPAILDGKLPDPKHPRLPNASGHPESLFTLLGGTYRMHVEENNTRLCPEALCGASKGPAIDRIESIFRDAWVLWLYEVLPSGLTHSLPDVTQSWADFKPVAQRPTLQMWNQFDELTDWRDRVQDFREFVQAIGPSPRPALHFLHILLPHAPWEYLPSGQKFTPSEPRIRGLRGPNDKGQDPNWWVGDDWAVVQSYQRHLLQVGLVDRLVGELVQHLRETGLYDSSLLIITADHGTSFRPDDSRRYLTARNHADLMSMPLFIKLPGQREGDIDDRNVETIDILPTITDVLDATPGWTLDGHSVLLPEPLERRTKIVFSDAGQRFEYGPTTSGLYETLKYKMQVFGATGEAAVYRAGDRYGWTGKPAPAAAPVEPGIRFQLDRAPYYLRVDPKAAMFLTNVTGRIVRSAPAARADSSLSIAVAVNGSVQAVTQTYGDNGSEAFAALVPDTTLHAGRNEIGLFLVRAGGTGLSRIEQVPVQTYDWSTRLTFGKGGSAEPFCGTGWGVPEDRLTWTDGHAATLYLAGRPPASDLTMTMALSPFTYNGVLPRQRVRVLVNGHEVADWLLYAAPRAQTARIPKEYLAGSDITEIAIETPDAVAPITIGANNDSRALGVAMSWIEFARK